MSYCDYDVVEWRPLSVLSGCELGARCGHGAFAGEDGDIVLVGGKECSSFNISRVHITANSSSETISAVITEDITNEEMVKQKPRFAFASTYCSEEKIFFMHGGFDSQYNHSGTRFFFTDPSQTGLRSLCTDNRGPSPRGYHSAVYVRHKSNDNNKVYTFGGQCCQGGPYTFFNDVHSLDLRTMDWSHVPCTAGDAAPSPRSQSFCFAYQDGLYVYGGYDGRSIFTDLHRLDLSTREWRRIQTKGTGPVGLKGLFPLDFTIYFCQPCGVLIGHRLVVLTELYDKAAAVFYTLNLRTREWSRLRGRSGALLPVVTSSTRHSRGEFDPPARGNASLTLAAGGTLFLIGGHVRDPDSKDVATRIWTAQVPRPMSWDRERLLWLACYKNDRGECNLAKCPPHVMYHIIGLINSNTFHIR